MDPDPVSQPVQPNASARHLRYIGLQFNTVDLRLVTPAGQKQRDDAASGPHVHDPIAFLSHTEIGEQHRVRAEPESVPPLDDAQAVAL